MKKEEERKERGPKRGERMEERGISGLRKVIQRRNSSPKSSTKGLR